MWNVTAENRKCGVFEWTLNLFLNGKMFFEFPWPRKPILLCTQMHYAMARVVASYDQLCNKLSKVEGIQETKSLADLMDGRLLYVVLYLLQKFTENDIKGKKLIFVRVFLLMCSSIGSLKPSMVQRIEQIIKFESCCSHQHAVPCPWDSATLWLLLSTQVC